jgi:hypothetical protein
VYWANKNPQIIEEKVVNIPEVTVWCGLSSRGLIGPYSFEETVMDQTYLQMLKVMIPHPHDLFDNES